MVARWLSCRGDTLRTVVLASQKGGVGKTTLCGHLAVEAARRTERRTAVLDTDPQGGLAAWWNVRAAAAPEYFIVAEEGLGATLSALREDGISYVFIDTPPALTASIAATVAAADLVVVPTKPSPHDLRAVGATVRLVGSTGRPLIFVINQAVRRARLTADAAVALSEHGIIAPTIIHHRLDFVSSMIDGRTAQEVDPASEASHEIEALWTFLSERTTGGTRHVTTAS